MNGAQFGERDTAAIRDYLASFDLFVGNEAEGQSYIGLALERFLITLSMIPRTDRPGQKLLELGGNPYFLTLLMKRFRSYDITLANYFGAAGPANGRGKQVVSSEKYDETHEFEYDHFNGEIDEFPYPDHAFDVVLNCEIFEHLTLDPTAYLCECQRVLKPGGALVLTTPNVLAFQNLWRLGANRNVYDQYSGYGVYGRHNREYTPRELIEIVEGCGFKLEQIKIADIYPAHGLTRILKGVRQHWRDNLFLVARASGRPIYYYPGWLYRSMASLRHVRRPDIVMGENDVVQIGKGWHPLERLPYPARWTSGCAVAYLRAPARTNRFVVEASVMHPTSAEVTLTLETGGVSVSQQVKGNEWREVVFETPEGLTGEVEAILSVTPTFNPKQLGTSEDNRDLGVLVRRLGFDPGEGNDGPDRPTDLAPRIAETQSAQFYGREYYDGEKEQGAKSGYAGYSASDPAIAAAVNIVTRYFAPSRVLDLGCAKGFLVDALRRTKIDAWGLDVSSYAINAAPPAVRPYVAVGSCTDIDKPACAFDLVVCNETLEHLTEENALRTVAEIYRVSAGKAWITTPSLGPNDFGPPNGWPQGKIQEAALPRYLANRDFPDPAPIEDLQLDDRGRPIHGHLIAASYRWWTRIFTRQGFIRRGDIERRMNKAEPLLAQGLWNSYVFEKPAWDLAGAAPAPASSARTALLAGVAAAGDEQDICAARLAPPGLLGATAVQGLRPGAYLAVFELHTGENPEDPWSEVARLEVRSHEEQWIHGVEVVHGRDLQDQTRFVVPFSCSAGEDLAVEVHYEGHGGLRVSRSFSIEPRSSAASETE